MKPITLRLGENNELKFKLQLQGITSNPQETKPRVRFLITEKGIEDDGILVPVIKDKEKEGFVTVSLQGDPKFFTTEKVYEGSVEVLIGNRYFNAAKYELEFMKEMKVEVESIIVNNKNILTEESDSQEEKITGSSEILSAGNVEPKQEKETKPEQKHENKIDEKFASEFGTKLPKQATIKEDKESKAKQKIKQALAEKLKVEVTNPLVEKLAETAYKKYQKKAKD